MVALLATACGGCGPTCAEVGRDALLGALPVMLSIIGLLWALDLRWGRALPARGPLLPHAARGAAIGALATAIGVAWTWQVIHAAPTRVGWSWREAFALGTVMINPVAATLALIAWRTLVRSRPERARVVGIAVVPGVFWALMLLGGVLGGAREFPSALGLIILYGGLCGGVPLLVFVALFVEAYLHDRDVRRASLDDSG
jgi:hypothetical protein